MIQMKFNNLGDRLGCLDSQGIFYLFKIDNPRDKRSASPSLSKSASPSLSKSASSPLYVIDHNLNTLHSSHKSLIQDFVFLSNSTILALLSPSTPALFIYDLLHSTINTPLQHESIGGNLILYSNLYQIIIISNLKKNSILFYSPTQKTILKTIQVIYYYIFYNMQFIILTITQKSSY